MEKITMLHPTAADLTESDQKGFVVKESCQCPCHNNVFGRRDCEKCGYSAADYNGQE